MTGFMKEGEEKPTMALVPFLNFPTNNDQNGTYIKFDKENNGL